MVSGLSSEIRVGFPSCGKGSLSRRSLHKAVPEVQLRVHEQVLRSSYDKYGRLGPAGRDDE